MSQSSIESNGASYEVENPLQLLDNLLDECNIATPVPKKMRVKKELTEEEKEERRLARNEASRKSKAKDREDLKAYRESVPKLKAMLAAYIRVHGRELAEEVQRGF